jgi:hypothetical protein
LATRMEANVRRRLCGVRSSGSGSTSCCARAAFAPCTAGARTRLRMLVAWCLAPVAVAKTYASAARRCAAACVASSSRSRGSMSTVREDADQAARSLSDEERSAYRSAQKSVVDAPRVAEAKEGLLRIR